MVEGKVTEKRNCQRMVVGGETHRTRSKNNPLPNKADMQKVLLSISAHKASMVSSIKRQQFKENCKMCASENRSTRGSFQHHIQTLG